MPTTTPFNNLITFSRGSNATVTGSNGLIQWAPNNVVTFSEQFDNAAWAKTNATIFPNQDVGNGTLGTELQPNGDFAGGFTSWTPGSAWSIVSGRAFMNYSGTGSILAGAFTPVVGSLYLLTFDYEHVSGSNIVRIGGTEYNIPAATGTYRVYLRAGSTTTLQFSTNSGTAQYYVDNVSVREVTPAAATAPDGTRTADNMIGSTGNNAKFVSQSSLPSTIGTFTVYAKAAGETVISLWLVGASVGASFTLTGDGSTSLLGATSSSITPVGGGWYRCAVYHNTATTTAHVYLRTGSSFIGDGTSGVLLWGAQLELGSTATTYNPTTVKNLLGFSEAFDNVGWIKLDASTVAGAQANPINGLFNAQKFMEGAANAQHAIFRSATVTAAPYTFSLYAKLAPGATRFLSVYPQGSGAAWAIFDLNLGTITAVSALNYVSSSITPVGGGWYRCSVTLNASAGTLNCAAYLSNSSGNSAPTYTGDGNSGVYIYGAQLSDSASLDPYVPTPGAAPSSTAFYGPRFDFDPVTLQPRGLLVEEQRTNLLLYSDDLSPSGTWPRGNVTVTPNTTTAPDGTLTADTVAATTTGTFRYIYQSVTLTNAVTYTLTVYLKYKTARYVWLLGETSGDAFAIFDLLTGTVGSVTAGVTRSITPVGNGWYRCSATFTVSSATGAQQIGFGLSDTDTVANPSATAGIDTFAWGLQIEAGAFATSYIPTVASTVTRSADVATISGSLFSQWYRQDEGSVVWEGSFFATSIVSGLFSNNDGSSSNRVDFRTNSSGFVSVGGVTQASFSVSPLTVNAVTKLAVAIKLNDFAAVANGGALSTDTSGTVPTVSRMLIGALDAGANYLNGHIRSINYVPARAADFQLQAITTQPIVDYFFLQTATGDQLVDGNGDYLYSLPILG